MNKQKFTIIILVMLILSLIIFPLLLKIKSADERNDKREIKELKAERDSLKNLQLDLQKEFDSLEQVRLDLDKERQEANDKYYSTLGKLTILKQTYNNEIKKYNLTNKSVDDKYNDILTIINE